MPYKPVNPTAAPLPKRKRGRPCIYDRPMSWAQRKRRSRWMRGFLERLASKRGKVSAVHGNWYGEGPVDMIANELAHANFDIKNNQPNLSRWVEIDAYVRFYFKELQKEFS